MSLTLIQESAKEVRRLAIAGSPLAVGDFRLKKLIPPLEQAGAKVPVFAQVAKGIGDLVNGPPEASAMHLLNLSTLLNAILYTQGQTSADGAWQELESVPAVCTSTKTPARVLKPLVQALTTTGSGRFEIVQSAYERGAFNDMRLIDPAIQAFGDSYPELADLVAEKILPGFGPGIVPRLKATLDIKGKKPEARKLAVMHQVDPAGTVEICQAALEDGSPEVKAAAITCLGQHAEYLPLVMEQTKAKNKLLRTAALEALAAHDRPEITTLFTDLIKGKALDLLAGPFRALRNRQVLNSLIEEGRRVFALLLKGDEEQIPRFTEILDCLEPRKDTEAEAFLLGCFEPCEKLGKLKAAKNHHVTGTDLVARLAGMLYNLSSAIAFQAILAKREALAVNSFGLVFRTALRAWPPDQVFEQYSPLLQQTRGQGRKQAEEIVRVLFVSQWDHETRYETAAIGELHDQRRESLKTVVWDPRWLDAAIQADHPEIVWCLAKPGHQRTLDYLLKTGAKDDSQMGMFIQVLVRCQYPKVTEVFLDLVARRSKKARYVDYALMSLFDTAKHLPVADLPKLDAFAATLDEKFVESFLEALAPLRSHQQTN